MPSPATITVLTISGVMDHTADRSIYSLTYHSEYYTLNKNNLHPNYFYANNFSGGKRNLDLQNLREIGITYI
jgi:hypothetical protein